MGKIRQNTTRRTALRGREHYNLRREILMWGFVLGYNTQLPLYAYEGYTCAASLKFQYKIYFFLTLKINARMMHAVELRPEQASIQH